MLLPQQASAIVREAIEQVSEILPVRQCWLYGSYARGDFHEESDIDILMTADTDEAAVGACRTAISHISSRLSLEHDITVSIVVRSAAEFEKRAAYVPFYMNVIREGCAYAV